MLLSTKTLKAQLVPYVVLIGGNGSKVRYPWRSLLSMDRPLTVSRGHEQHFETNGGVETREIV